MASKTHFDRWGHVQQHSWPFKVYKQYNAELSHYIWVDYSAAKYVYKHLGKTKAKLTDPCNLHFSFPAHVWNFPTVEDWSKCYNDRQNQFYLDCVMALSSNLETFLSTIISLAIESDPGVLLGASRSVDGVVLLKQNPLDKDVYSKDVEACVKGDWNSRVSAIKSLFGSCPQVLEDEISNLEGIRKLRNKVGHAFGRDIEESRDFTKAVKLKAERISLDRLKKYLRCAFEVAKAMDQFLLNNQYW